MCRSLIVILVCTLACPLAAQHTDKPVPDTPANIPQARQGGDTISEAYTIEQVPFSDSGTTTGYTDDYDEVCPYAGSTSPDVVYQIASGTFGLPCRSMAMDLYGSSYDTKIYVYDSQLTLIACNDDYYSDYTSLIDIVHLLPSETYYVVIDGYGGDHGEYQLDVVEYVPCYVACPPGFWDEGEPPLQDEIVDSYNSGCDGNAAVPAIIPLLPTENGALDLCGRMGWTTVDGELRRDLDWFRMAIGAAGIVEGIYMDSLGGMLQVLTPGDCDDLEVQQTLLASPCSPNPFTISGEPGSEIWLRVATSDAEPACGGHTPQEWEYTLELSGLQQSVTVQTQSWSAVKALYHR